MNSYYNIMHLSHSACRSPGKSIVVPMTEFFTDNTAHVVYITSTIYSRRLENFVLLWSSRAGPSRPGSAAKPINPPRTTSSQWVPTTALNTDIDFDWSASPAARSRSPPPLRWASPWGRRTWRSTASPCRRSCSICWATPGPQVGLFSLKYHLLPSACRRIV